MLDVPAVGSQKKEPLWTRTFTLLVLLTFLTGIFNIGLTSGLALYAEWVGLGAAFGGTVVSVYAMVTAITQLASGPLVDQFNRHVLFIIAAALMAGGCIIPIVQPAAWGLLVAAIIQGMGNSVSITVIMAVSGQVIPPSRLGEGMGYRGLGVAIATTIGPSIVIWTGDSFGAPAIFVAFALTAVLCALMSFLCTFPPLQPDVEEAEEEALGAPAEEVEEIPPNRLVSALGHVFSFRSLPAAFVELCRRIVTGACTAFILIYGIDQGFAAPQVFFLAATVVIVATRVLGSKVVDRVAPGKIMGLVFVACIAGFAALLLAPSMATFLIASLAYGLSEGFGMPVLSSEVFRRARKSQWGVASANFYLAGDMGMAIGALVTGVLMERVGSVAVVDCSLGALVLALIATVLLLRSKRGKQGS